MFSRDGSNLLYSETRRSISEGTYSGRAVMTLSTPLPQNLPLAGHVHYPCHELQMDLLDEFGGQLPVQRIEKEIEHFRMVCRLTDVSGVVESARTVSLVSKTVLVCHSCEGAPSILSLLNAKETRDVSYTPFGTRPLRSEAVCSI